MRLGLPGHACVGLTFLCIAIWPASAAPIPPALSTVGSPERTYRVAETQVHGKISQNQSNTDLQARGLLPLLGDSAVVEIIQELTAKNVPSRVADPTPRTHSSSSVIPETRLEDPRAPTSSSDSEQSSDLPVSSSALSNDRLDPPLAPQGKPFKTPEHLQAIRKKSYDKNRVERNLKLKIQRELEQAIRGDEPSLRLLRQREANARFKQKDELRVELEAAQNPDLPKPLTKAQIRDGRRKERKREQKAAREARLSKERTREKTVAREARLSNARNRAGRAAREAASANAVRTSQVTAKALSELESLLDLDAP